MKNKYVRYKPLCVFATCSICGLSESIILQPPMTPEYAQEIARKKFEWRGWIIGTKHCVCKSCRGDAF